MATFGFLRRKAALSNDDSVKQVSLHHQTDLLSNCFIMKRKFGKFISNE